MYLLVCLGHDPSNDGHVALGEQLEQISKSMGISIDVAWKDPMASVGEIFHGDGVIVPNGPTPSFDSQVLCCKTARESGIPFLGICGGLQAAAVDVARHLASLSEANSVEYAPDTSVPIVHENGKPCIRTPQTIQFVPGRYLAKLYGSETMEGIVRCGRFVNQKYWPQLERAGLELLATSTDGERILAFRLLHHPFYIGVAYLPQFSDKKFEPLLKSFLCEVTQVESSLSYEEQDLKIRKVEIKDVTQIIQLWQKFGDYHSWLDTPQALAGKVQEERGLFLLAEVKSQIIGSVMGSYDGRFAFVARLVVAPEYRRRGIATRLMEELETRLRNQGASQVSLLIEDNNDPAISLYKKMDYEFYEGVSYMRKRLS